MRTKNLVIGLISVLTLFTVLSCNSVTNPDKENSLDSLPPQRTVQLSTAEKSGLTLFFTSFSEIYLPTFSQDKVPDSLLIQFGVYYNYRKHFKTFKQIPKDSKASIDETLVADTAYRFFGQKIKKHQSIEGIEYKNNNYLIYNSDGEVYRFSQILELTDLGDGVFQATIEIFDASSGFTGDINANPETWKTAGDTDIPKSEGKMKTKIRKVNEKGKTGYVLLEYLKL